MPCARTVYTNKYHLSTYLFDMVLMNVPNFNRQNSCILHRAHSFALPKSIDEDPVISAIICHLYCLNIPNISKNNSETIAFALCTTKLKLNWSLGSKKTKNIYIYIYILYIYIFYIYTLNIPVCMHVYIYIHIYMYMYIVYVCIYMYIYTCIIYIYMYIHIYIYTEDSKVT